MPPAVAKGRRCIRGLFSDMWQHYFNNSQLEYPSTMQLHPDGLPCIDVACES